MIASEGLPRPSQDATVPSVPWLAYAGWALVALGVVLRVARYLADRSLWLDEAALSLNIAGRSLSGLTHPLAYNQGAPLGFLTLEKACVLLFGVNEYALRLIPLLAGIGSLFLFRAVARRCLRPAGALAALTLFVVNEPLIYYSSEVKQYSTDVLICLCIVWAALRTLPRQGGAHSFVWLGLAGAVGVWFSHAAAFVMAGTGVVLVLLSLRGKDRQALRSLSAALALWALSFALDYLLFLKPLGQNQVLLAYWQDAFAPEPWRSVRGVGRDLHWAASTLWGQFTDALTVGLRRVAAFLGLAGAVGLWWSNRRALPLLLAPVAVTLLAACLHKYPFQGRLVLFLVPLYQLLVAAGLQVLWSYGVGRVALCGRVIGLLLFLLICAHPIKAAAQGLAHPPGHEELRTVLRYVARRSGPQDTLCLYYGSDVAYDFYTRDERPPLVLTPTNVIHGLMGRDASGHGAMDLARLRGLPRVWVVFSHVMGTDDGQDDQVFLNRMNISGRRLDAVTAPGAAAYLYDLRPVAVGGKTTELRAGPGGRSIAPSLGNTLRAQTTVETAACLFVRKDACLGS